MALTVANPANLMPTIDPTIELQHALSAFKQILSDDQRKLHQMLSIKPDAESATLFIANTAAKNQGAHGQFLWKRLCPFLQATQQFLRIVDTFVSSNPTVAALVWGGIKTTILAAGNASSYFDQVTSMLMEIGRLSPTFNQYGQLYVGNPAVQSALCKFYTVVVRLCTKVVTNSQRGLSSHVMSTFFNPFESDFKPFLDELRTAAEECRDQFSLASKQVAVESSKLLDRESKRNEAHRRRASIFRSDVRKEQQKMEELRQKMLQLRVQETRDKIRNCLSTIDHLKAWRLTLLPRVSGTAEWFQNDSEFVDWTYKDDSSLFWCSGTMGVGKTVFVSNLIAHLFQHKAQNDAIAFHLCRSDQDTSLSARGILGTIARQLLETKIQNAELDTLDTLLCKCQILNARDIADLVLPELQADRKYYILIDGLDECEKDEVQIVKEAVIKFYHASTATVKLLFSGRPELESQILTSLKPRHKVSITRAKVQADIEKYIEASLDDCLELEKLKLSDPTLILRITKTLKDGAQGMFLWARFFIRELCSCLSDEEILQALEHPPRGLTELLAKILCRIKHDDLAGYVTRTLQFCLVARRPLTCCEMQEAVSVHYGQTSLERGKMPTDMGRVIAACRGLIFLDEVDNTIHCVHHSLRAYIFGKENAVLTNIQELSSDILLGSICLTYLRFNDFQRQITKTQSTTHAKINPVDMGLASVTPMGKLSTRVAQKLLRHQPQLQKLSVAEMSRRTQEILGSSEHARLQQEVQSRLYHFLDYAKIYWIDHFRNSVLLGCSTMESLELEDYGLLSETTTWRVLGEQHISLSEVRGDFNRAVHSSDVLICKPWLEDDDGVSGSEYCSKGLYWAIRRDHAALFLNEMEFHRLGPNMPRVVTDSPPASAWTLLGNRIMDEERGRLISCMKAFMATHGIHDSTITEISRQIFINAVGFAVELNRPQAIFLARTHNLSAPSALQRNGLLVKACLRKYIQVVSELLKAGYDPNRSIDQDMAEYLSWEEIPPGCSFSIQDGELALVSAIKVGSAEIVRLLLDAGADPVLNDRFYPKEDVPLSKAIQGDHLEIVDMLLMAGVDPNSEFFVNKTPLFEAAELGSPAIVRRLLAGNASPEIHGNMGLPLEAAIRSGNYEVCEILIQPDVFPQRHARTPRLLPLAIEQGRLEIVDMLLSIDYPDKFLKVGPALIEAVIQNKSPVVQRVLDVNPPLNSPDVSAILTTAIQCNLPKVVRIIIENHHEALSGTLYRHLTLAAGLDRLQIVKILTKTCTDVSGDEQWSPMLSAIRAGRARVVKLLIDANPTIDTDPDKIPFVIQAIHYGNVDVVRVFLRAGALTPSIRQKWEPLKQVPKHPDGAAIRVQLERYMATGSADSDDDPGLD